MLMHNPEGDVASVAKKMESSLSDVRTGEITTATRSVEIDGVNVETGQVIALLDGKLVLAATSVEEACMILLKKADIEDYELITMFVGADFARSEANRLADVIQEKYPDQEVEMQDGGQPHYQLIIAIE